MLRSFEGLAWWWITAWSWLAVLDEDLRMNVRPIPGAEVGEDGRTAKSRGLIAAKERAKRIAEGLPPVPVTEPETGDLHEPGDDLPPMDTAAPGVGRVQVDEVPVFSARADSPFAAITTLRPLPAPLPPATLVTLARIEAKMAVIADSAREIGDLARELRSGLQRDADQRAAASKALTDLLAQGEP